MPELDKASVELLELLNRIEQAFKEDPGLLAKKAAENAFRILFVLEQYLSDIELGEDRECKLQRLDSKTTSLLTDAGIEFTSPLDGLHCAIEKGALPASLYSRAVALFIDGNKLMKSSISTMPPHKVAYFREKAENVMSILPVSAKTLLF